MKQLTALILALVLLVAFCPPVWSYAETVAEGKCGTNLTWTLDSAGVFTVSGTGPMTDYSTGERPPWYADYRTQIKTVVIKDGVASIGKEAFFYCNALKSVAFPDSVETIGSGAFGACTSLDNLKIGSGVKSIENNAFGSCSALKSVTIPDNVESMGSGTFSSCGALAEVTIGKGITAIEGYTFYFCSSLEKVTFGRGVKRIEEKAFYLKGSIDEVFFMGAVPTLGTETFHDFNANPLTTIVYYNPAYKDSWSPNGETVWNGMTLKMMPAFAIEVAEGEFVYAFPEWDSENSTVSNIPAGTTVETLGEVIGKTVNGSTAPLMTGDTVKVDGVNYTVIVTGDVDCDAEVTASDASKILRSIVRLETLTPMQEMAAKLTGDTVTAADAAKILRLIVRLEKYLVKVE